METELGRCCRSGDLVGGHQRQNPPSELPAHLGGSFWSVSTMRDVIAVIAVLLIDLFAFAAVYPTQAWDALGWLAGTAG